MKYKTTKKEDFWESKCDFCIVRDAWEINSKNDKKISRSELEQNKNYDTNSTTKPQNNSL
jgi:hypothetical protein